MDETVPHGEIIHLPDLAKAAGDMHDRSVRTIGRLVSYDAAAASATIALDGASIAVDVANVPAPDPHKIDSLYQYIGEVDGRGPDGTPCLRARVARCVDGLDLKLYGRALHERNKFLNIKG